MTVVAVRLALLLVALAVGGCATATTEQMRTIASRVFGVNPLPVPIGTIEASVAIESEAVYRNMSAKFNEVLASQVTDDMAKIFTKPIRQRQGAEDFLLKVSVVWQSSGWGAGGGWGRVLGEAKATVLDGATGATLASVSRSTTGAYAKVNDAKYTELIGGLRQDLIDAFQQPNIQAKLNKKAVGALNVPGARSDLRGTSAKSYDHSWALVVGINAYRHAGPLNYAVNDAQAIAAALPSLGFDTVRVLLDQEATKEAIEKVIYEDFKDAMRPDDRLFLFFAGHGLTTKLPRGGEEGYLVPVDGDPKRLERTTIPMDEVRKMGRRVKAKHIFVAIDACFSGFAVSRDIAPSAVRDADLGAALQEPVVQVLTAGRKGQRAIEEEGHGLFTRRLLEALRGVTDTERRGFITGTQLGAWVGPRVSRDSGGLQTPQFSALDGEGDFVFLLPTRDVR